MDRATQGITDTLSVGPTAQIGCAFIDLLTALTTPAVLTIFSKSSILDKVREGITHIFGVTRTSLQHSVG